MSRSMHQRNAASVLPVPVGARIRVDSPREMGGQPSTCGGVGPAKRMLERARELGFRSFLGCMEETSVGIAASASVASLAEWVDLDGNLLLDEDPFEGLELGDDCRWRLSDEPGLGIRRRSRAAAKGRSPAFG